MRKTNLKPIIMATIFSIMMIFSSCASPEPTQELPPIEESLAQTFENDPVPLQDEPGNKAVITPDPSESPDTPESPDTSESPELSSLIQVDVLRVVDGDTIEISLNGVKEKVRFIGVDTPESVHPDADRNVPYGTIATAFTKEKLDGKTIELEFDVEERDRYGRLLAYVYIGGEMFNKMLLDEGHASVSTYPPNVKYVDMFTEAQTLARDAGKGQWSYYDDVWAEIEPTPSGGSTTASVGGSNYIGTTNSYKFHYMDCQWGQKITPNNAAYFSTRDEAISAGFVPCKVCNP